VGSAGVVLGAGSGRDEGLVVGSGDAGARVLAAGAGSDALVVSSSSPELAAT